MFTIAAEQAFTADQVAAVVNAVNESQSASGWGVTFADLLQLLLIAGGILAFWIRQRRSEANRRSEDSKYTQALARIESELGLAHARHEFEKLRWAGEVSRNERIAVLSDLQRTVEATCRAGYKFCMAHLRQPEETTSNNETDRSGDTGARPRGAAAVVKRLREIRGLERDAWNVYYKSVLFLTAHERHTIRELVDELSSLGLDMANSFKNDRPTKVTARRFPAISGEVTDAIRRLIAPSAIVSWLFDDSLKQQVNTEEECT